MCVSGEIDIRIGGRYRLGRRIGSGSFGDIYLATDLTSKEEVAVKLEHSKAMHPQLHMECKFYKVIYPHKGAAKTYIVQELQSYQKAGS